MAKLRCSYRTRRQRALRSYWRAKRLPYCIWTRTRLNWCGRALSINCITCQRFLSAVILWHWVVPKSSDQTLSVSLESYWRRICPLTSTSPRSAPNAFFQLRQLRHIRRSLDDDLAATLVQAFVASWVEYYDSLLIDAPKKTTDKLQRVLNAAAQIVSNTRKYTIEGWVSSDGASFTG